VKALLVSAPASLELAEAVGWYEERRPGWGGRLFDAVSHTFTTIASHPEIGSPRRSRPAVRQLIVRGFPYIVVYRVRPDDVHVIAVAHTRRRPGYWQNRR
jgi:plasmid stabilization system protein ParE